MMTELILRRRLGCARIGGGIGVGVLVVREQHHLCVWFCLDVCVEVQLGCVRILDPSAQESHSERCRVGHVGEGQKEDKE